MRDQAILFNNLDQPQRLSIGPWTHTMRPTSAPAAEHLRWWDYWLKGIDNGILREDPVHYYVIGAPEADSLAVRQVLAPAAGAADPLLAGGGARAGDWTKRPAGKAGTSSRWTTP